MKRAPTSSVAPDLPGYGDADKPDRVRYTVDGYARHLGGILDQLDIHRVHLVLHDFGGPWGLTWAAEHPDRFASVTLVNCGVLRGYRWHYLARIWRTPVLGEAFMRMGTFPALRLLLRHGNPRGLPLDVLQRMYRDYQDPAVQLAVLRLYRATDLADSGPAELDEDELIEVVPWPLDRLSEAIEECEDSKTLIALLWLLAERSR